MSAQKKGKRTLSRKERWKKRKKIFLTIFFSSFVIASIVGTVYYTKSFSTTTELAYPEPTKEFYIDDYSGVFTQETEEYILEQAVALNEATKAQIVVVAVPTNPVSLSYYSYDLANKWGIGDDNLDNGVLILFTTDVTDPHVRMEVGKGLEGCLPDGKAGRILDDWAVEAKNSGCFNEAAINTWVETAKVVYTEYGLDAPKELETVKNVSEKADEPTMADAKSPEMTSENNPLPLWLQIIIAFFRFWFKPFIPFLIFSFIAYVCYVGDDSKHKHRGGSGGGNSDYGSSNKTSSGGYSGGGGSFGGGGASR